LNPHGIWLNMDPVMIVKLLILEISYGLLDLELERQADERLSFHRFPGYTGEMSDATMVWLVR